MAVAGAGEAVPAITIAVGLLAALMFVVFVGLHGAWTYTFGWLFDKIGGVSILGAHPLGFVKDASDSLSNALLTGATKSEHLMGYLFHWAGVIQGWMARELVGLAADVYSWATWLQRSHLPKWVKALIYSLLPPLILPALIKALRHVKYGHIITRLRTIEHTITHTVTRVVTKVVGAGVALPGWVIRLPHRVRDLERDRASIWKRLRGLEKYAGAAGAVALFTAALARLGLKWIRCRNVTRVGKRVCSMDNDLLTSLLGDAVLVLGTVSVVEFARDMLAFEKEAVGIIGGIVREWPD